ncbi:hypothetical protein [Vibrio algivorus]|uniref:Uncharacterized protein n=1 Tax=Vibrio algivorus TaxID=1667024 RepID=A0A557PGX5_9VIBR|nr:hypothetical protein [Vibrio algivorus]TVO39903.1 hypothetical protein FOF44_00080 [Vibrio algivorus]
MKTDTQSTKLAKPQKIEFHSQVYASLDEFFQDLDRARRDENYTRTHRGLFPRTPTERHQILTDKIAARRRLQQHDDTGGTALMFSLPLA